MNIVSRAYGQDTAIAAATRIGDNVLQFGGPTAYILLIVSILFFLSTCGLGYLLLRLKDQHAKEIERMSEQYADSVVADLAPLQAALGKIEVALHEFQGNLRTDLKDMFSGVQEMAATVSTLILKLTEAQGDHKVQAQRLVDRIDNLQMRKR